MSLITPEILAQNYWQHECPAKEGAIVFNEHGRECPFCSTPEPAAPTAPEPSDNK